MGGQYKEGFLKYLDFNMCKNYRAYGAVNAHSPESFTSLKQVEKYKAGHEKAYLTLNTKCEPGSQDITTIKLQPFTYDEKSFNVTLCDLPENITEEL